MRGLSPGLRQSPEPWQSHCGRYMDRVAELELTQVGLASPELCPGPPGPGTIWAQANLGVGPAGWQENSCRVQ